MIIKLRRPGFTLIEMLVVIGIILVLATLTMFIAPRLQDDQRTARGSDVIQGWLMIAKQQAHRDQVPRGIRIVPNAMNPSIATELFYIEQPEDYNGLRNAADSQPTSYLASTITIPSPIVPPPGVPPLATAFIPNRDLVGEEIINATGGDFVMLDSYETVPANGHRIFSAAFLQAPAAAGGQFGTHLVFGAADNSITNSYRPVGGPVGPGERSFRIVRQPRVMVGEKPLQLPRDVIIDLANNFGNPALTTDAGHTFLPGGSLDIVFGSRGQVIGANAIGGKIILRVRNGTRNSDDGDQLLITVHTRTGLITSHPVNTDPPFGNVGHDPYRFIRDGKSSGM